jgi:hypothetical protein
MKAFRNLHLAAHGESDPVRAYRTALILAPDPDRPADPLATEGEGTIGAEQIARTWELDAELVEFEDRFFAAVELDATAILAAVLTFDGARQWVYYTGDVQGRGERLNNMPQSDEPNPLELTTAAHPSLLSRGFNRTGIAQSFSTRKVGIPT